jgi:hypothetical protein
LGTNEKKKHVKSYRKAWEITKTKGVTKGVGKATVLSPRLLEYYLTSYMTRAMLQVFFLYKKYKKKTKI